MMVFPPFNRENYKKFFLKNQTISASLYTLELLHHPYPRKASEKPDRASECSPSQPHPPGPPACAMQGTDAGGKPHRLPPPSLYTHTKKNYVSRHAQRNEPAVEHGACAMLRNPLRSTTPPRREGEKPAHLKPSQQRRRRGGGERVGFSFFFFCAFTCRRPEWSKRDPRSEGEKEFRAGGGSGREGSRRASQPAKPASKRWFFLKAGPRRRKPEKAAQECPKGRGLVPRCRSRSAKCLSGSCPSSADARPDRACQWSWRI